MGKSHQAGWVVRRVKRWHGYFRKRVLNPKTEEEETKTVCVPPDVKSKMTKFEAVVLLQTMLGELSTSSLFGQRVQDTWTTCEWFVRKRYFSTRGRPAD